MTESNYMLLSLGDCKNCGTIYRQAGWEDSRVRTQIRVKEK